MDKKQAIEIAKEYADSIKGKYNIVKVILFGSYANSNFHKDSDIDIAIIINNANDIIDTQIELMKLRRKIDLRIEPHPFDVTDFNNSNPLASEILKYGIDIKVA